MRAAGAAGAALALAAAVFASLGGCLRRGPCAPAPRAAPASPAVAARIARCRAVLARQVAAWNRGDIRAFADGYWRSPHTIFSSEGGSTRGFAQMVARYERRYPDRAAMGTLAFARLRLEPLGARHVLARGGWRLARTGGTRAGEFVLVMRDVAGACRIVLDHTTLETLK